MTDATETSPSRLELRRVRTRCIVPAALDNHRSIERSVVRSVVRDLPGRLGQLVSQMGMDGDPAVWRIRRLEVSVDLPGDAGHEAIARAIGLGIAKRLAGALVAGDDSDNVRRFRDGAHYLAEYLGHRAAGGTRRWDFGSFEGLAVLPVSSAMRTAIERDTTVGLGAMLQMDASRRGRVIAAMSSIDAVRVLDALSTGTTRGDAATFIPAVAALWSHTARQLAGRTAAHRALQLYLATCETKAPAGPALRAAVLSVTRLAERLDLARRENRAASLHAAELRKVIASLGDEALPFVKLGADAVRRVAEQILAADPVDARRPGAEIRHTRFGYAFLLLPFINDLPLVRSTVWPGVGDTPAEAIVRFLLMLKCCGGERRSAFGDPVLRDLMGIGPRLTLDAIALWSGRISGATAANVGSEAALTPDEDMARQDVEYLAFLPGLPISSELDWALSRSAAAILRAFAGRLTGFASSHFAYLWTNFLNVRASIEDEPSRRVVRISPPPLALILNMSGLGRARYSVSWLDGRPLELFPTE